MLSSRLLQIADSAFPTGAFAYSHGLEALARAGRFPDGEVLESYLQAYVSQAISQDLPFLNSAHRIHGDRIAFTHILREWDACFWNDGVRKASLRQGKTVLGLMADSFAHPDLEALRDFLESEPLPPHFLPSHFLPLLAAGLAILDCGLDVTQSLYLYMLIRDQVTAAVRLGLLGPRSAQIVQARLLSLAESRPPDGGGVDPSGAWKCAPVVEVGQAGHGFLYSRLFQN